VAARRSHCRSREALLTSDELVKALRVSEGAVLVGGQALAFWVDYFHLSVRLGATDLHQSRRRFPWPPGTRQAIRRRRGRTGGNERPDAGSPPSVARVTRTGDDGRPVVLIDVLNSVVGIESDEVRRHAIRATYPGDRSLTFQVMHPLDCMVSRFENLRQLEGKRDEVGIWQAHISIDIGRAYIHWQLTR
jgi:hypothetical protein